MLWMQGQATCTIISATMSDGAFHPKRAKPADEDDKSDVVAAEERCAAAISADALILFRRPQSNCTPSRCSPKNTERIIYSSLTMYARPAAQPTVAAAPPPAASDPPGAAAMHHGSVPTQSCSAQVCTEGQPCGARGRGGGADQTATGAGEGGRAAGVARCATCPPCVSCSGTADNAKLLKGLGVLQACIERGLDASCGLADAFVAAIQASQTHPARLACVAPGLAAPNATRAAISSCSQWPPRRR